LKKNYKHFLNSPAKDKWKRIGTARRSGVVVPLFSIYSKESTGIGEMPDLKLVVDWCVKTGMSIIQLLPLNETGYDFSPYNTISTFALELMYLRLNKLRGVNTDKYDKEIKTLKKTFGKPGARLNFEIKDKKLTLLRKIFNSEFRENESFRKFIYDNNYWIKDYAAYKILKERNKSKSWEEWKTAHKKFSRTLVNRIIDGNPREVKFLCWLQWQMYEQLKEVKEYANAHGVLIMGDMPFLVSKDSADVWSHQRYFKLNLSAGAPPDFYFAFGQKWGMPPYNWDKIESDNYRYIKERLRFAENFYNMYRIDHFVGLFRIWTFESDKGGEFDPPEKKNWENHGKKIINAMLDGSSMLPCAEDLGTVPYCSYKTLKQYGIPGIDFQRFIKKGDYEFALPREYRKNSSAVISTHDSSFFPLWWKYEAGTTDKALFEYLCRSKDIKGNALRNVKQKLFDKKNSNRGRLFWKKKIRNTKNLLRILNIGKTRGEEIIKMYKESYGEKEKFMKYLYGRATNTRPPSPSLQLKCIEKANESDSIFSIQLIQEYLFLSKSIFPKIFKWNYRINSPGTMNQNNWSIRLPLSMEKLLNSFEGSEITKLIKRINTKTNRS
jgi:4-alpha-glucanotransferase